MVFLICDAGLLSDSRRASLVVLATLELDVIERAAPDTAARSTSDVVMRPFAPVPTT
jgi:hypothetical protein